MYVWVWILHSGKAQNWCFQIMDSQRKTTVFPFANIQLKFDNTFTNTSTSVIIANAVPTPTVTVTMTWTELAFKI